MKKTRLMLMILVSLIITDNCQLHDQNNGPSPNAHSKIYWFDLTEKKIKSANLNGTEIEEIVTGISTAFLGNSMTIDKVHDKLYWTEYDSAPNVNIHRADMDGANEETVVNTTSIECSCLSVNTDDNLIYWTSTASRRITQSDFSGNMSVLLPADGYNTGLFAVFYNTGDKRIHWGNFGGTAHNSNKIISVDASGNNPVELTIDTSINGGFDHGTDRMVINPNDGKIYYSFSAYIGIKRQNLDGTGIIEVLVDGGDSNNRCNCLDIDPVNSHMYYTDATGNIMRADFDGGNITPIINNANQICDIAVY